MNSKEKIIKRYPGKVKVTMRGSERKMTETIIYGTINQARFFTMLIAKGYAAYAGEGREKTDMPIDEETLGSILSVEDICVAHERVTGMKASVKRHEVTREWSEEDMSEEEGENERSDFLEYIKNTKPNWMI